MRIEILKALFSNTKTRESALGDLIGATVELEEKIKERQEQIDKLYQELNDNKKESFKKGEFLYIGKASLNEKTIILSVGYTLESAMKQAREALNLHANPNIENVRIVKVENGSTEPINTFKW